MRINVILVIISFSILGCNLEHNKYELSQVSELIRVTPESQGVSSRSVADYLDSLMAFPQTEIHSVMVLRHGRVISEIYPKPYNPEYGHPLFSCSKIIIYINIIPKIW